MRRRWHISFRVKGMLVLGIIAALALLLLLESFHERAAQNKLLSSVVEGDVDDVKRFLADGANANWLVEKKSLLALAVERDKTEIVALLIAKGANVNLVDDFGKHYPVIYSNSVCITEMLLDHGADIDSQDMAGFSPLHVAVIQQNLDLVRLLVGRGAAQDIRNGVGLTPLHKACERGNLQIVRSLIASGASVNVLDNSRETPLVKAVRNNREQVAKLLLDKGAGIDNMSGSRGHVLEYAWRNRNLGLVELLMARGAELPAGSRSKEAKRLENYLASVRTRRQAEKSIADSFADYCTYSMKNQSYTSYLTQMFQKLFELSEIHPSVGRELLKQILVRGRFLNGGKWSENSDFHQLLMAKASRLDDPATNRVLFEYYFQSTSNYRTMDLDGIIAAVILRNSIYQHLRKRATFKGFYYFVRQKDEEIVHVDYFIPLRQNFHLVLEKKSIGDLRVWLPTTEQIRPHVNTSGELLYKPYAVVPGIRWYPPRATKVVVEPQS